MHFAVDFPIKAEWKTGDVLLDYDVVLLTDGSNMVCRIDARVLSDSHSTTGFYGIPGFARVLHEELELRSPTTCTKSIRNWSYYKKFT